jgi:hypothetical protein
MEPIQRKREGRSMLNNLMSPTKAKQLRLLVKKERDQGKGVSKSRSFIQDGSEC